MIISLQRDIGDSELSDVQRHLDEIEYRATEVVTQRGRYLVGIGRTEFDIRRIGHLSGVVDVFRVSDAYKLVSRKWKVEPTVIDLGDGIRIGEGSFAVAAGPCSIETEEQTRRTAAHLAGQEVRIMRGGVFKPRTSPYAFRGAGLESLRMFASVAKEYGLKIISEVMEVAQIEPMADYVDIFQVGARNTQNFNLLDALGEVDKPVLIKRGISGTLDELLQSAEYVFSAGNEKLILCERGIRTFETAYRNTLDLNAVPVLKQKTHLPVIVDPSHGVGRRDAVEPMALAAVMAGADGLLLEIHESPETAVSDGQQTLDFCESARCFEKVRATVQLRESL